MQAYMATWQAEPKPYDDTSVTLTLSGKPQVVQLPATVEPQLVIMFFTIAAAEHPEKQGLLISGQLHIRTPQGKTVSITTKTQTVKQALQHLEQHALSARRGAPQPTAPVMVLTGDVNLERHTCDTLVHNEFGTLSVQTQWQVLTSNAALSGDVLFIKGARGRALDVTVGKSYIDRGIRNDQHDFFGATPSIPMCDKSPRG